MSSWQPYVDALDSADVQARLALQNWSAQGDEPDLDALLATFDELGTSWQGSYYAIDDDELPAALWALLCHFMPRIECVTVVAQS